MFMYNFTVFACLSHTICSIPAVTDSGESLKQRQNILVVTRKSVCRGPVRPRIVEHTQEAQLHLLLLFLIKPFLVGLHRKILLIDLLSN